MFSNMRPNRHDGAAKRFRKNSINIETVLVSPAIENQILGSYAVISLMTGTSRVRILKAIYIQFLQQRGFYIESAVEMGLKSINFKNLTTEVPFYLGNVSSIQVVTALTFCIGVVQVSNFKEDFTTNSVFDDCIRDVQSSTLKNASEGQEYSITARSFGASTTSSFYAISKELVVRIFPVRSFPQFCFVLNRYSNQILI